MNKSIIAALALLVLIATAGNAFARGASGSACNWPAVWQGK